ncbi:MULTISPECIES: RIP metalloprotease RseP [unclassified Granulicatella]|uniref:RIP metalloprotease RseP n=1 Tax=unclassified Granulicatella TaxID=2630493 RepID=UPI00107438D4|nr:MULTISPECIES: RIP metalloprotease RseP [unclassified Granulicatella]MBF0779581.1 RIP metalloprotease RseP [Granulicatella sp. 19428wC4_WM01]TFU96382.1 RIP metalloprotease RseP [Granulicatella sp. WM01]
MTIFIFLLVFSVIVTIHEFGHFYFAKKSGVLVREFAIGMGPKIFATRHNGTTYTIRMLPIGGYVRLAGRGDDVEPLKAGQMITIVQDDNQVVHTINTNTKKIIANAVPFEVHASDLEKEMILTGTMVGNSDIVTLSVSKEATFIEENGTEIQVAPIEKQIESIHPLKKMLVNFAGPMNNFILGIVLFILFAFISGGVSGQSNKISVVDNSSALLAGIQNGDKIVSVNGQSTPTWQSIVQELGKAKETNVQQDVSIEVEKENQTKHTYKVVLQDGKIGVSPYHYTDVMSKITYGFTESWRIATNIFSVLGNMFTKGLDIQQFGGPVAIAQTTGQVAEQGFIAVIWFTAMLSINLGIMNLLPIPVLDGGKILLNSIELLRGKPISPEKEMIVTMVGAGIMIVLVIAVTFNDIMRLFR